MAAVAGKRGLETGCGHDGLETGCGHDGLETDDGEEEGGTRAPAWSSTARVRGAGEMLHEVVAARDFCPNSCFFDF